jgi:diguanylate cyclase (GGDEF)-like protein
VLLVESGGRLQAALARGLDDGEARALAFALEAHRIDAIADRPVTLPLPNGRHALAFLARKADQWLGALLAVSPTRVDPAALSAGTFLASHVGLALQTAGRMAAVEDLAYQDDLTGLFNTRYLDLVLGRELRRATASGEPLSLLFMDLDRFKQVNDRHGHLAGSKVLQEFGKLLQRCVRDCDVVVRYGGDEFVVVLLGTPAAGALRIAERIRSAVEAHAFLPPEGVSLTVCVGVASSPEHGVEGRALLALADSALFQGKRDQRNTVRVADLGDASKAG